MLNAVIDLSHWSQPIDFVKAKAAGVLAMIHKATDGPTYNDGQFRPRMKAAAVQGILCGAYHFLAEGGGVVQAEHFIDTVTDFPGALLAVDIENEPSGPSASLKDLRDFVTAVHDWSGKWPLVYGGWYLRQLLAGQPDEILANCGLWVSDYRRTATPEIPSAWTSWVLWQYTDDKNGNPPHDIAGIFEGDRDIFNGTEDELRAFWAK